MKNCNNIEYNKNLYLKKSYKRKTEDNGIVHFKIESNNKNNFPVLMNIVILIFIFHILLISKIVNCAPIFTRKLSNNFIILKVKEIGKFKILGSKFQNPSQIIINGKETSLDTYSYNFTRTDNTIKLYWNEPLTNCSSMFYKCFNITEIDLSNFVSSKVVDLSEMFYQCNSLNSINFGNFDTSSVTNMNGMFLGLLVITILDLSSFNTSKVVDMSNLFSYLEKIEYINIDNFDTSSVTSIQRMFLDCFCLKSINLLNFKSNSLTDISYLFHNCKSLISVDLSALNTSKVTLLNSMFNNCQNLEKINVTHFSTSLVTDTRWMFNGCTKLTSIDISNFDLSNVFIAKYMFSNCENLEIIKFNNLTKLSQINETTGMFQNCKKIISLDLSFINASKIVDMANMFYNCDKLKFIYMPYFKTNLVKNMTSIFSGCQSLEILNIYSFVYNTYLNLADIFKVLPNNLVYCIYDNSQLKDINSILQEKNMINNCSYSCSFINKKMIDENSLCIDDCTQDINNNYEFNNKCYNDCPNGTKSSPNNKYFCVEIIEGISNTVNLNTENFTEKINAISNTIKGSIPENGETNLITYIQECSSFDFFNKKCKIDNDNDLDLTKNIIEQIKNDIKNGNLKSLLINITNGQKEDLILEESNIVYQITTSDNQNKKTYKSISTIKLGKCEDKLKDYYNITSNETLLIFKIDIYEEGLLMPIVEYEIYNQENFTELDLNICKDETIQISVPVSINEDNLDIYDPKSNFYNDICYPYTSENGTDIVLNDRITEFIDKNLTLCENNCTFIRYNSELKQALCECNTKIKINIISDLKINKEKLLEYFLNIKNFINLEIIKCYKLLLTKKGMEKNIGSYVILSTMAIYIITLFIFAFKGYKSLISLIDEIIKTKRINKEKNQIKSKKIKVTDKHKLKTAKTINKNNSKISLFNNNKKYMRKGKKNKTEKVIYAPPLKKSITINKAFNSADKSLFKLKKSHFNSITKRPNKLFNDVSLFHKNSNKIKKDNQVIYNLNDYEYNSLSYKDALKYDKRTYWEYYSSLIKTKQTLIFSFCICQDYNSSIIKIFLFFFFFDSYFTVNALFYSDSTIHEIYKNSQTYNILFHLPQIIYSTIISSTISIVIRPLSLTEKSILEIKYLKSSQILIQVKNIIKCLKIKLISFFILSFIFILIFWFYLSCFCAVYRNTQYYLIKDTLISFTLSLLYPFGFNLLPGLLRITSLKDSKKDRECLFKISKIISIL